jgi:hypothetical protein
MYTIAIPSFRRPKVLKNKTLKLLESYNINPKNIIVFMANQEEYDLYREELCLTEFGKKIKLVIGERGIKNIRNFMANYFKEKGKIFYIDDDISHIFEVLNKFSEYDRKNNKMHRLKDLNKFITDAFKVSKSKGCDNWGIYPVENPYFMKPTTDDVDFYTTTKLNYIMGGFTGVINNKKAEIRTIDDKEDYERSIKYYLKDNGVLRFNNVCVRTRCYTEPGGMQTNRTKERIHDSAVYLTKKYPLLCTLNTTKKSGFTEVRLRDRRFSKDKKILSKINCDNLKKNKTKKLVKIRIEDMKIPKCNTNKLVKIKIEDMKIPKCKNGIK